MPFLSAILMYLFLQFHMGKAVEQDFWYRKKCARLIQRDLADCWRLLCLLFSMKSLLTYFKHI